MSNVSTTSVFIENRKKKPWGFLRGIGCRGLLRNRTVGYRSETKQNVQGYPKIYQKQKHPRLSQNISETETSTTSRSPQIDAPGNKAVGDTFGPSNNPLYPEKSVPKRRSEKWKFCLGRTIGVFQSLQLEGCVGFATTRV